VSKKRNLAHRDNRSKLDLELFVLALVRREISTPYLLRETVGLSPGATIPVLDRLEQAGYLRRGKPGVRGRTEYTITGGGKRHLSSSWQPLLADSVPTDIDAVLRIASLAMLSGSDRETVAAYLRRAATEKRADSKRRKGDALEAEASLPAISETGLYDWLQATHKSARLTAEAKLLRQLATAMLQRT
jgi:DNA-binding PadR family transcriptional regulator